MNEGHPADGNEGLFSSLFKKITGKVKKDDDVTEEEIRKEVRRACEEYAPHGHFIPCITYGGPGCLFPHVDSIIDDEIEKYNKEHSCNSLKAPIE